MWKQNDRQAALVDSIGIAFHILERRHETTTEDGKAARQAFLGEIGPFPE